MVDRIVDSLVAMMVERTMVNFCLQNLQQLELKILVL